MPQDADAEAGDEHMAERHGEDNVPAAALATAPGKLHVNEHVQHAAGPFTRVRAVRHQRPHRQHRRRPQSGETSLQQCSIVTLTGHVRSI